MFYKGIPSWLNNKEALIKAFAASNDISDQLVWDLLNLTANEIARHFDIIALVLMIMVAISIIIGIAILWNQRKIKKQLHQLLEQKEERSNQEPSSSPEADNS